MDLMVSFMILTTLELHVKFNYASLFPFTSVQQLKSFPSMNVLTSHKFPDFWYNAELNKKVQYAEQNAGLSLKIFWYSFLSLVS